VTPTTSLTILSTDEAPMLEAALAAAVAQEPDEVVVVDNASADATPELARRAGARLLRLERRLSYAAAMNASISGSHGDLVAFLQADTFVAPGYLEAARAAFADPLVGSVAPKLVRARGPRPEDRLGELDAAGMVVDRRRKNGLVGHGAPASAYARRAVVFGADGAAAVYRRAALDDVAIAGEVFDVDLERWASDADLAWRAHLLGWRCVYEPAALAHHVRSYSPSTRAEMSQASRRMQFRNRYLMIAKNEGRELVRDLPFVLGYEVLALGHVLLRERHLLPAYRDAWRRLPAARRRRRAIQEKRVAGRARYGLEAPA
jgi:GT2 family glycosyltransferase